MAVLSSPIQLIQSIPPVTRAFTFATILFSGFYAWLRYQGLDSTYAHWFLLIPGTSFFSPWTFLTSALVELSIFEVNIFHRACHVSYSNSSLSPP